MEIPFLITVISLTICLIHSLCNSKIYFAIYSSYILLLIFYNFTHPPNHPKFITLHPPPTSPKSNSCRICNREKPCRYYHCRKCATCVFQMDHHCEWLGSCVAYHNFKIYFHILVNFGVLAVGYLVEGIIERKGWLDLGMLCKIAFAGFVIYEVFVGNKRFWEMVVSNQTLIESYKLVKGKKMTKIEKMKEIFGGNVSISWFIPTFIDMTSTNIYEETQPIYKNVNNKIEEYEYADEYIYGADEDEEYEAKQKV